MFFNSTNDYLTVPQIVFIQGISYVATDGK